MTSSPLFRNSSGGVFKISGQALAKMRTFIQDRPHKTEAGGVLLGRFIVGSNDVIVDNVTVPMAGDTRRRNRFSRIAKRHQEIIDHAWTTSLHRCNYLGGWHTHSDPVPDLSGIDMKDWRKALRREQFDNDVLYFLIVGIDVICVWEGQKRSGRITQLRTINGAER